VIQGARRLIAKETESLKPNSIVTISLILACLCLVAGATTSTTHFAPATFAAAAQRPIRFSSAYSSLTKCGSGMTKKEEREAEKQGSDIPTRCKGYGGYDVYIYYSACASIFTLNKGEENIPLGMQALAWKQKTVEWRLANGKPFAVIMRVYEYAGNDLCTTDGKITGSSLIVKGLKGYEIDETVDAKSTPNPNGKAREIADQAYAKTK
jgi:hypothetical protein